MGATVSDVTVAGYADATPPGRTGPDPAIVAATHPPRPDFPAAEPDTGAQVGVWIDGRGAWGFCAICYRPLTRSRFNQRQVTCSQPCARAARVAREAAREAKPCEICGQPCRSAVNRTCGPACALIWRRTHGRGSIPPERAAKITALWEAGYTQSQIAHEVGVSKHAIAGYRHRHLADRPRRNPAIKQAPLPELPKARASRPALICQPAGADRRRPGRFCSAHPEIRWHPADWRCRSADPARDAAG